MRDSQATELRRIFRALEIENVLTDEWRVDPVDELAMSYKEFDEILDQIKRYRKKGPKDWFPKA